VNTPPTTQPQDFWNILHDLIFGVPPWLLAALEYGVALFVLVAVVGSAVRIWKGDRIEIGPLKIQRPAVADALERALEGLANDDKLKSNVLWMFRDRLNEANRIISDGLTERRVHAWTGGVLTDVASALSRGGYDRHRTSIWVRADNHLRIFNGVGFREEALALATLPLESIAGSVMRTGTPYNSADINTDRSFFPKQRSGRPFKSLLAVPVKNPAAKTLATLCIDAESQGYFDTDDEFLASCFADLMSLLISQIIGDAP
jgi:hypothetical protein